MAHLCDTLNGSRDGEDSLVDALDDLADPCLDACLVSDVRDILACFTDDDPSFLGADQGAKGETFVSGGGRGAGLRSGSWYIFWRNVTNDR